MNTIAVAFAAIAAIALSPGLAAPAWAQAPATPGRTHAAHHPDGQTPPPPQAPPASGMSGPRSMTMMGGGMGMMPMMMSPAQVDQRIATLKADLAITEAQQPQWAAFASAMRAASGRMAEACGTMMADGSPGTAPDRLERRIGAMAAHLDAARAMLPPLQALYAVLTDAQKTIIDRRPMTPMGHM